MMSVAEYSAQAYRRALDVEINLRRILSELEAARNEKRLPVGFHIRMPSDDVWEFLIEDDLDEEQHHYFFARHRGGPYPTRTIP